MLTIQSNLKIQDLETLSKTLIKPDIINFGLNKVGGGYTDKIADKVIAKLSKLDKDKTIVIINDITLQMADKLLEAGYTDIYLAFGGFNKEDVLEYIRAQQTQLTDTQKKLKETEETAAAASKRTRELETLLSEQQTRAEEYFALSEEYAKKIFALEDEVNSLNEKLNSVEVGCERAKDVEGQIGALVLDALLYSDKIIRSTKASAKGISNQTRQTIEEAASGVDEIGEDISQMSDNFGVVVASLVSKINSLSSNLNSVADKLDVQDEEIDEHQFTFGENGEVKLPKLTDEDFGDPTEPEIEISDEEINNLVNVLNASGGLDLKFTAPDESSENVTEDIHSEENTSDEPIKADDAEEISELTKKFLGED